MSCWRKFRNYKIGTIKVPNLLMNLCMLEMSKELENRHKIGLMKRWRGNKRVDLASNLLKTMSR
jgi:hypothetical protein